MRAYHYAGNGVKKSVTIRFIHLSVLPTKPMSLELVVGSLVVWNQRKDWGNSEKELVLLGRSLLS
jgi:hypothetical protein